MFEIKKQRGFAEVLENCPEKARPVCKLLAVYVNDVVSLAVADLSSELGADRGVEASVEDSAVLLGTTLRSEEVGLGVFLNLLDRKSETLWDEKGQTVECNSQNAGPVHCQSSLDEVVDPGLHVVVGAFEVLDWQSSD